MKRTERAGLRIETSVRNDFAPDSTPRRPAKLDVAGDSGDSETLAVGQLRERHRQILIPTGQIFQIATTAVAGYALLKLLMGEEFDQLREYGAPRIHLALSPLSGSPPRMLSTLIAFQIVFTPERITLNLQRLCSNCRSFPGQQCQNLYKFLYGASPKPNLRIL